jgi:hypothetical protein
LFVYKAVYVDEYGCSFVCYYKAPRYIQLYKQVNTQYRLQGSRLYTYTSVQLLCTCTDLGCFLWIFLRFATPESSHSDKSIVCWCHLSGGTRLRLSKYPFCLANTLTKQQFLQHKFFHLGIFKSNQNIPVGV